MSHISLHHRFIRPYCNSAKVSADCDYVTFATTFSARRWLIHTQSRNSRVVEQLLRLIIVFGDRVDTLPMALCSATFRARHRRLRLSPVVLPSTLHAALPKGDVNMTSSPLLFILSFCLSHPLFPALFLSLSAVSEASGFIEGVGNAGNQLISVDRVFVSPVVARGEAAPHCHDNYVTGRL